MTDSGSLTGQLWGRRDVTALAIRDALVDQLPGYAGLSEAGQRGLFDDLHYSLSLALEHSAVDEPNTEEDLEFFRELGGRRGGRPTLSFADLVATYDVAEVVALRDFWQVADTRSYRELLDISAWSAREVPRAMESAAAGYIAARCDNGEAGAGQELVVKRLLEGEPAASIAAAAGITLPATYSVVLCAVGNVTEFGAEQRARVRSFLEGVPGSLVQATPHKLLILLPVAHDPGLVRPIAAELVTSVAKLTGQSVPAALSHRPTLAEIPDAVAEAAEILTLLSAMPDAVSRPYVLDELLVELAIARRPDIAKRLADQLTALEAGPDLRRTLQVLFSCDLDRERTKNALHIHRRTLSYRLNRIRELSGIDPTTAHGIQLLRAALTASRMSRP